MHQFICADHIVRRQIFGSLLGHVMACCLRVPNHFPNQCWLIISNFLGHSSEGNFLWYTSAIDRWNLLENHWFWISFEFPMSQLVNCLLQYLLFCVIPWFAIGIDTSIFGQSGVTRDSAISPHPEAKPLFYHDATKNIEFIQTLVCKSWKSFSYLLRISHYGNTEADHWPLSQQPP